MNLAAFCKLQREKLDKFEKQWEEAHKVNPEQYPIEFTDDNVGIWGEMLEIFDTEDQV